MNTFTEWYIQLKDLTHQKHNVINTGLQINNWLLDYLVEPSPQNVKFQNHCRCRTNLKRRFFSCHQSAMHHLKHGTQDIKNSYSASHNNWCTATLWNRIMTAQCEGMGEVGSVRYEPALLPPCPSIRALCYSNCQRSTQSHQQSKG